MNDLTFKKFAKEDYPEYKSWFADPELDKQLGPMDAEWLAYVLSVPVSKGIEWAIFRDADLVAVAGIAYDPEQKLPPGVTEIAVKPTLCRQGIATAVLHHIFAEHERQGSTEHMACIHVSNAVSLPCFKKLSRSQLGHSLPLSKCYWL